MRPNAAFLELFLLLGPFLLGAVLLVPVALLIMWIIRASSSDNKKGFRDPLALVYLGLAIVTALVIVPGYVSTVNTCRQLEAEATSMEGFRRVFGETDATTQNQMSRLQNGCDDLVIRW